MADTAQSVMSIAAGEVGYSRWDDPNPGTKYGRWYAGFVGDSYYGTSGVPYCAMFTSWVFAQAGAVCPGLPGAYCPWIVTAGRNAGQTVPVREARYGDVVLFDWGGDGVSDHIGLVEGNNGSYLSTIEGNTSTGGSQDNGGKVLRRTRAYSTVICVIRPKYSGKEVEVVTNDDIQKIAQAVVNTLMDWDIDGPNGTKVKFWAREANTSDYVHNMYTQPIDPAGTGRPKTMGDWSAWGAANTTDVKKLVTALCEREGIDPEKVLAAN